ncbi:MAG: adenylate kinase [Planctomycetota bacterium]
MRIILIGPPGAGKGTQSALMADAFGIPHLSTGEILRAATAEQTQVGIEAAKYMERGDLVPDEMIQEMVFEELSKPVCEHGYILDGFPRTVPQAEEFDRWLASRGRALTLVLKFSVSEEVLLQRLAGRGREDDNREIVTKRMEKYLALTKPLVDYYQDHGVLRRIQGGMGSAEDVFAEIQKIIASLPSQQPANKS